MEPLTTPYPVEHTIRDNLDHYIDQQTPYITMPPNDHHPSPAHLK